MWSVFGDDRMIWVLVFGGIAVCGLIVLACFARWLWRLATALLEETGVLMGRAEELAALLDQIELPSEPSSQGFHSPKGDNGPGRYADNRDLTRGRAT